MKKARVKEKEILDLIKKIEKADRLASVGIDKQNQSERLQIQTGNQTGIVFSLHR